MHHPRPSGNHKDWPRTGLLRAHVPEPPDTNPEIPPEQPPSEPDREVDLPPREDPERVRDPQPGKPS